MKIFGEIKNIRFYNEDNGYTIASFLLSSESFSASIEYTSSKIITIVGSFDRKLAQTEEVELEGDYSNNNKYGMQFIVKSYSRKTLQNEESIIRYLSSSIFSGIGEVTASKIVNKLGLKTIDKIIKEPSSLEGIGLSRKQIEIIKEGVVKDQVNQEALLYYLSGGLTIDIASKIINTLGINNLNLVKNNPYILMDKLPRFGFIKNDKFALSKGLKKDSLIRLEALTYHLLKENLYNTGNSYVFYNTFLNDIEKFFNNDKTPFDINKLEKVLNNLSVNKKILIKYDSNNKEKQLFDYNLYKEETKVIENIKALINQTRGNTKKFSKDLINEHYNSILSSQKIKFNSKQEEAILNAFLNDITIITGGPGTGKTTIIKAIIALYQKLTNKKDIAVLAPTGRAAKRIQETSNIASSTIHRYLGYDGVHFASSSDEPKEEELVIVDEASMIDINLFYHLITSINPNARIIIVGDVDQLPSIGPGQVLKDLIDSKEINVIKLEEIHRQKENSSIISLAHSINEGYLPESLLEKKHDRSFLVSDNNAILSLLLDVVKKAIDKGFDILKDIQILIPMYRGIIGIDEVNKQIQNMVNPKKEIKNYEITHFQKTYRVNDKIIQLINRPEKGIMNGDIGYITSINKNEEEITGISCLFDDVKVDYTLEELEEITLAYAITIHKAQGSEFNVVIMPISSMYYPMLKRKLIYTGITRAKEKLILLGDPKMLNLAAGRLEANRYTILKDEVKNNNVIINEDIFVYNEPLYQDDSSTIGEINYQFEELNEEEDLFGELVTLDDEF